MSYDYDRRVTAAAYSYDRTAADTHTPVFDKLFKDHAKIDSLLGTATKKLSGLADKIENVAKKNSSDPQLLKLIEQAVDATYKVLAPFRDLLSKGKGELDEVAEVHTQATTQAKHLFQAAKDLGKAYDQGWKVMQDKEPGGAPKAAHEMMMAVSTLKTILGQYERVFGLGH